MLEKNTPITYQTALRDIVAINLQYQRAKTKIDLIKVKLDAVKGVILENYSDTPPQECIDIPCDGGVVKFTAARKTVTPDFLLATNSLERVEQGLAVTLAQYKTTDLRQYLSTHEVDSISEVSYGSRTCKVVID